MVSRSSRALLVLAALAVFCLNGPFCLANPIQGGTSATAQGSTVLWYGGDYGGGPTTNNTMLTQQYGSSVLADFVVDSTSGWHVTGLFSNNFKDYAPASPPTLSALWSIRASTATGDPGQVLSGGMTDAAVTPTGRANEYQVSISGLSLDLKPGVYFMQVSPISPTPGLQDFYVGQGIANAVGTAGPSPSVARDSALYNGTAANRDWRVSLYPPSMGVVGEAAVPEPGSIIVFGLVIVSLGVRGFLGRPRLRRT